MRAKTLLCLAALAAGAATTMAQSNVYSLNIVGYVTYTQAPNTFRLAGNPLNATNNDVKYVFTSGPQYPGLTVYKRNSAGTGYDQASFDSDLNDWNGPLVVNPGDGLWVFAPPGTPFTNTFVGEVKLNSTNLLKAGFDLKASALPQQGLIQTDLLAPGAAGDVVYIQNSAGTGYDQYPYDSDIGFWAPEPVIPVAKGFWYYNAGANKNWIRNFSVGP
jgi:hypothetical protein